MLTGTLQRQANGKIILDTAGGQLLLAPDTDWRSGRVFAAIRPEKISLSLSATSEPNQLSGQIEALKYAGGSTEYHVRLDAGDLVIGRILNVGAARVHSHGDAVWVNLPPQHLHVLDDSPDAEVTEPAV